MKDINYYLRIVENNFTPLTSNEITNNEKFIIGNYVIFQLHINNNTKPNKYLGKILDNSNYNRLKVQIEKFIYDEQTEPKPLYGAKFKYRIGDVIEIHVGNVIGAQHVRIVKNNINENYKIPLIPDAVNLLKNIENIIIVNSFEEYENIINKQKYFSASHSHCFYTIDEYNNLSKNGSKYENEDSKKSDILKNVGDLVAVLDNKNNIGYILPNEQHHKQLHRQSVYENTFLNKLNFKKLFNKNKITPKYTPDPIPNNAELLTNNDIFVFGSNTEGKHFGGAAKAAVDNYGAIIGQARGLQGNSYGIVTLDYTGKEPVTLETISKELDNFITFAKSKPSLLFLMTKIGTSIAGYNISDIIILFKSKKFPNNVKLPLEFS